MPRENKKKAHSKKKRKFRGPILTIDYYDTNYSEDLDAVIDRMVPFEFYLKVANKLDV